MRKFLFLAVMVIMCMTAAAQENQRTVIVSSFSTREVEVATPAFFNMACDGVSGYAFVEKNADGRIVGFMTVVEDFDIKENAPCIKVRIAYGQDMTIFSFFNGWTSEVSNQIVRAGGYLVGEGNDVITFAKDDAQLILNKADFAANKLTLVQQSGWQKVN